MQEPEKQHLREALCHPPFVQEVLAVKLNWGQISVLIPPEPGGSEDSRLVTVPSWASVPRAVRLGVGLNNS